METRLRVFGCMARRRNILMGFLRCASAQEMNGRQSGKRRKPSALAFGVRPSLCHAMSDPLFAAWSGPDTRPFVPVFEPWGIDLPPAGPGDRRSLPHASEVAAHTHSAPVKFSRAAVSIDHDDLLVLRSCGDLVGNIRREWQRGCEAYLRAALEAAGVVPAGAGVAEVLAILDASPGKLSCVVGPDGSRGCSWGSAFLCVLPPDPVAAWRASVDARLRDGLF